jgi:hypothetical protein
VVTKEGIGQKSERDCSKWTNDTKRGSGRKGEELESKSGEKAQDWERI